MHHPVNGKYSWLPWLPVLGCLVHLLVYSSHIGAPFGLGSQHMHQQLAVEVCVFTMAHHFLHSITQGCKTKQL